ncbi:hypothetical protein EM89_024205 [Vibrio parahaemolyticus]|nr:hypothetical protein EM88_023245 [Vibrio parahaemolyticus]OQS68447.1 hypothetical protein EM89_024205 [Vibrio parahaemolyticus]OQS94785.1 hypothetical protein EN04_020905 [Vibrio parahaemolyticus O4:K12 str. K1203]
MKLNVFAIVLCLFSRYLFASDGYTLEALLALLALLRNIKFTTNRSQNSEPNSSVTPAIYQAIRH